MKKIFLGFLVFSSMSNNSFASNRDSLCKQIKTIPAMTAQGAKPSAELLQLTKKYQQLWKTSCDRVGTVDFPKVIADLEKLSKGIETAASANYDEELPRLCSWAALYAPGLVCPDPCCVATASIKDDSLAKLLTYALILGSEEDKTYFEKYALIFGEGSSRGTPWLNETMAAGVAMVDGCLNFSASFWKEFFSEVSRKKKLLKSPYYKKTLLEQETGARNLLSHLSANTCACSGKNEVIKNLDILLVFLKPTPSEQNFLTDLKKTVDQIRSGQIKISNHYETQCGGG